MLCVADTGISCPDAPRWPPPSRTALRRLVRVAIRWRSGLLHHMVPTGTPIEKLVSVEGHRWVIEDSFETAKNEFGFDHNETRSWHGWHRHVSLVILAFAMMLSSGIKQSSRRQKKPAAPAHPLVDP